MNRVNINPQKGCLIDAVTLLTFLLSAYLYKYDILENLEIKIP